MDKFVIENTLYLPESIKENGLTSYAGVNLKNNSNGRINYDKLERLSLDIQKFAQMDSNLMKKLEKLTTNSFIDITENLIGNANPNSYEILDAKYFVFKEKKYKVDGKNVVIDYSKKEKEVAEWLESTFGGELYMLPRINFPEGIQTADYLFRGEYWDLKEINGNGKNIFFHAVEKHEKQSHNFIFDVSNSTLTDLEIDDRINYLYKLPKLKWLDKIIIKRDNTLIKIIKRSDPSD